MKNLSILFILSALLVISTTAFMCDAPERDMQTIVFTEYQGDVLNPDRGWAKLASLYKDPYRDRAKEVVDAGRSLAVISVPLHDYRSSPLPDSLIENLEAGLKQCRENGIKAIIRFKYSDSQSEPDADILRVLSHVAQLKGVLQRNSEQITALQAGFLGSWGEWYYSTQNSDGLVSEEDRAALMPALLDAFPGHIQVRGPHYKHALIPGSVPEEDGKRISLHNDCFLRSSTDSGTFLRPNVEWWRNWASLNTVMTGGESCGVSEYTNCSNAISDLELFKYSFLFDHYHPDVIQQWKNEGCHEEITRRLGYRVVLESAMMPKKVKTGSKFNVTVNFRNDGFAATPVGATLVMNCGDSTSDTKEFAYAPGIHSKTFECRAPGDMGTHPVSMWVRSGSAMSTDYPIRFANEGTWESNENKLGYIEVF